MEEAQVVPVPAADSISRPSQTSALVSASLQQLPGLSMLAASNAAQESPQLRATAAPQNPTYTGATPAATNGNGNLVSSFSPCFHFHSSVAPVRSKLCVPALPACGLVGLIGWSLHQACALCVSPPAAMTGNRCLSMMTDDCTGEKPCHVPHAAQSRARKKILIFVFISYQLQPDQTPSRKPADFSSSYPFQLLFTRRPYRSR